MTVTAALFLQSLTLFWFLVGMRIMATSNSPSQIEIRKRLAAGRRFLAHELQQEKPRLEDDWFPLDPRVRARVTCGSLVPFLWRGNQCRRRGIRLDRIILIVRKRGLGLERWGRIIWRRRRNRELGDGGDRDVVRRGLAQFGRIGRRGRRRGRGKQLRRGRGRRVVT